MCCASGDILVYQWASNREPVEPFAFDLSNLDAIQMVFRSELSYSSVLHFSSAHWGLFQKTALATHLASSLDTQRSQLAFSHCNLHFGFRKRVKELSRRFDRVVLLATGVG